MAADFCLQTNYSGERDLTAYAETSKLGESTEQIQPCSAPETSRYNVGKVRQLFEERRKQTAKRKTSNKVDLFRSTFVGRDKSYPLQPLRRTDPVIQILTNDKKDFGLRFDEIDIPIDQRTADIIKVSSWPTIPTPFDPSIFGKLPNLGGQLLSERKRTVAETENFTTRFVPSGTMSSRIPTKISTLNPVSKITDGVSRLSTNTSRTLNTNSVTKRQPAQKNYLTPVRNAQPVTNTERKVVPPISTTRQTTTNRVQETSRPTVNGVSTTIRKTVSSSSSNLPSCKICGRHFAADRLARHQEICEKSTKRKRKIFDPVKHRLKGTEAEGLINKIKVSSIKQVQPVKKTNWRQQHEEFLENIREARKVKQHLAKGGKLSDLPPPKPLDTSDYIQCPHCNRKFNETAAGRHIPKCATMRHNKPKNPVPQAHAPAAAKVSRTTKTNITRKR